MTPIRLRLPGTPEPMMKLELPTGKEMAADCWGPPGGRAVLLLHGGGQTRHAWRGAGAALGAAGYRSIALDLRGHGDSTWADDGDYGYDAIVEDLVDLVDSVNLDVPVLVGASLGGAASLIAVGEGRVSAGALVIVDSAPRIEAGGVDNFRAFMLQEPDGFESLEAVAEAIASYNPTRKRSGDLSGLAKNLRIDDKGRYHWHWDPQFMSTERGETNWEERQARMEQCARSLTLPTLLVRGGQSDMLSEEGAQGFLELCPHAEYANITGARHMVAGDRNDLFTEAVVEFLGRTAPPSG